MVEAASQMIVTAVVFVRTEGEHRNATTADTAMLFDSHYLSHRPRPVAIRFDPEVCLVSREWTKTLARLDIASDPNVAKLIISWKTLMKFCREAP